MKDRTRLLSEKQYKLARVYTVRKSFLKFFKILEHTYETFVFIFIFMRTYVCNNKESLLLNKSIVIDKDNGEDLL